LAVNYKDYARLQERWLALDGYPLPPDFPETEYLLRIDRARKLMAEAGLDALVVTSGEVGQWFTSAASPHEWHDRCPARSAWYVLTADDDYLCMTPTTAGEHMNTTRRATWVTNIWPIVERTEWPRAELWDIRQMPQIFARMGLTRGRLGFELGDCMTMGLSFNDFVMLKTLMLEARLVDASPVIRKLMSVHTPIEIDRIRKACQAGVWIHDCVPHVLRPGMTERELLAALADRFAETYDGAYAYRPEGAWDVRNRNGGDSNLFHNIVTDRPYRVGDYVARGTSGVSYRGYAGDVDRGWHIGQPSAEVERFYQITWECNRAMAEAIKPGNLCSDVYEAGAAVERHYGLPERLTGRTGHGLRNTGGLSVHPANHTVLEPNMVISVEPMFATDDGWFDLEDQYLVTSTGSEILHPPAPQRLPVIPA
jgi:Xaa-Pro aminopeptidase